MAERLSQAAEANGVPHRRNDVRGGLLVRKEDEVCPPSLQRMCCIGNTEQRKGYKGCAKECAMGDTEQCKGSKGCTFCILVRSTLSSADRRTLLEFSQPVFDHRLHHPRLASASAARLQSGWQAGDHKGNTTVLQGKNVHRRKKSRRR